MNHKSGVDIAREKIQIHMMNGKTFFVVIEWTTKGRLTAIKRTMENDRI